MFEAIGTLVSRYPRWVLAGWFLLATASVPFGLRVGEILTGHPEAPEAGAATAVKRVLATQFTQSEEDILVLIAYGGRLQAGEPRYEAALDQVGELQHVDDAYRHRTVELLAGRLDAALQWPGQLPVREKLQRHGYSGFRHFFLRNSC